MPVYEVAFSSRRATWSSLRDWVEYRLRPQLLTIEGVASVDVSGGLEREIQVLLDQERLRSYGLTVSQVIDALRASNQDVAAGRVWLRHARGGGEDGGQVPERGRHPQRDAEPSRAAPHPADGSGRGAGHHPRAAALGRLDGVPAVRMVVRKQPDANTVAVADGVDQLLQRLDASGFIPADIDYRTLENQASFIRNSVNSVRNAAVGGGVLAMLVVLLFLGSLRKTL
jgi:multidrug efflux pump subunit AcrB